MSGNTRYLSQLGPNKVDWRLDVDIAKVMMGINAVKGVEIGAGLRLVEQMGPNIRMR